MGPFFYLLPYPDQAICFARGLVPWFAGKTVFTDKNQSWVIPTISIALQVLRHRFATHFMVNGGNIITLQRILGHSIGQQILVYAHFAPTLSTMQSH